MQVNIRLEFWSTRTSKFVRYIVLPGVDMLDVPRPGDRFSPDTFTPFTGYPDRDAIPVVESVEHKPSVRLTSMNPTPPEVNVVVRLADPGEGNLPAMVRQLDRRCPPFKSAHPPPNASVPGGV